MNGIKNWLEKHETIYGVCLFAAGLCAVAFTGVYLGASNAETGDTYVINLYGDEYVKQITNG